MKELSIEEKAKAYDETLKVLHKYDGANIMFTLDLKEEMFPFSITHDDMVAQWERRKEELMKLSKEELVEMLIGKREQVGRTFG